jgi:TolB-like protein
MARTVRLNLLGRFEARWSDGKLVGLISKKAQALLAYLAAERRRAHTRDHLGTLLWSETGDARARHNLRQALSKIRGCCGPLITSRGDLVQIDPARCTMDVIEFERLANSDDPDELRECLGLYRGDLLDGLTPREPVYDEWLVVARGRHRRIACQTAERLASSLARDNRNDEAIEALINRLAMDPACEPQYQACSEALHRDLGAEPSAETKALYASIQKAESEPVTDEARGPDASALRTEPDRPTVAVLPFENLSKADDAYFADGIVEDIITALSCFHSLLVIARGSSFAYRGRDLSDRQIATELGAHFLVRGSVQRAGQRVRINVQLLDALAGLHVWGHRFDRELEDVFLVQDEIAATLASTLAGRVEAARLSHARRAPAERLEAYDFLLRGKEHHHRYTVDDCRSCIDMFGRAIERDPDYAVAHAWLACGFGQAMTLQLDDHDKLVDQAQAAAERGLALDENESECHRILAQVFLTRRNLSRSMWHQERALFLNPNE